MKDERIDAACRRICKAEGTAQCAPICLSHFSMHTRDGKCPHAVQVWKRVATAALAEDNP